MSFTSLLFPMFILKSLSCGLILYPFRDPVGKKIHANEVIERVLINELCEKEQAALREAKRYGNAFQS